MKTKHGNGIDKDTGEMFEYIEVVSANGKKLFVKQDKFSLKVQDDTSSDYWRQNMNTPTPQLYRRYDLEEYIIGSISAMSYCLLNLLVKYIHKESNRCEVDGKPLRMRHIQNMTGWSRERTSDRIKELESANLIYLVKPKRRVREIYVNYFIAKRKKQTRRSTISMFYEGKIHKILKAKGILR